MLAIKTLQAIEEALLSDQGAKFRGYLAEVMPLAGDAYSTKEDDFRSHLGASLIGRKCDRELWYGFRWTMKKKFQGRIIRLFNRGHLEEPRFIALLKAIGVAVWQHDENGNQFRIIGHLGHFGGSMDGVAKGIPDIPNEPILTEFKTHNDKSFTKLKESNVLTAKWEHFVQMQIYMGKNGLNWALYMAINKNDDDIYAELVQFDKTIYERYLARSIMIVDSKEAPKKLNESPSWYECKFCDYKEVCHGRAMPEKNCRTCIHSVLLSQGRWFCNLSAQELSKENQLLGCKSWEIIQSIKS